MPYTVEASFDTFYERINLSGDHREIANKRRDDIVSKLGTSFSIIESFSSGSIPKYTALNDRADLDVIVVLHFEKHIKGRSPDQVLHSVRDALAKWKTGARRNGQAVTLHYQTWPNVDIVPVSRTVNDDGVVMHYNVPDANSGSWIKSRPKAHAAEIEKRSSDCGYNFRRVIKMIKHWNSVHGDYLQSYHIEVLAIRIFDSNMDDTAWNVFQFFDKARSLLSGSLWHGLGFVDDYLSSADRQEVLKRFNTAAERGRAAWVKTYDKSSDHKGAIEIWRQIFGDKFPTHG